MKKYLAVLIMLLAAIPSVSLAGSATGRWDMAVGGYVRLNAGWADNFAGPDMFRPVRGSYLIGGNNIGTIPGLSTQRVMGLSNDWSDSTTRLAPRFSTEFVFTSDCIGRAEPYGFKVGLGGFIGKDNYSYRSHDGSGYFSDSITTYGAADLWWIAPIVTGGKKGDRKNTLLFTGNLYTGRGLGLYAPGHSGAPGIGNTCLRPLDGFLGGTKEPTASGGWAQVTYYLTDRCFTNAIYGVQKNSTNTMFMMNRSNPVGFLENYLVNVMYDINPTMRFGLEYAWVRAQYESTPAAAGGTKTGAGYDRQGRISSVRFGAYYFF